jgi:hypothetical protein
LSVEVWCKSLSHHMFGQAAKSASKFFLKNKP